MKSYEFLLNFDQRERDVWGKPIGPSYREKDWDQLTPIEMKADFDQKNDLLAAVGEPLDTFNFYDAIFSDLEFKDLSFNVVRKDKKGNVIGVQKKPYKLLLNQYDSDGKKINKIPIDEIEKYLDYTDVAISPCLFFQNWRRKKLLNYVGAFVLDIDKLRPKTLQRFLKLFDEGRILKPSIIVNSGSGVHFYYVLDEMFRCDIGSFEANNRIVEAIYNKLYDQIIVKEGYKDAQRHWVGQDYRVVGSKTRLDQICSAYRICSDYTIEYLMNYLKIDIDPTSHRASYSQIKYAKGIAKDLNLELPNFENAKETYDFIADNKQAAYEFREERRKENLKAKRKAKQKVKRKQNGSWYKRTYDYVLKNAIAGNRFNSLKALAIIAYKEGISLERFECDLDELIADWIRKDWNGDFFNKKNRDAILRLFNNCETYRNTRADTLDGWLGTQYAKKQKEKKEIKEKETKKLSREMHLEVARFKRDIMYPDGWFNKDGRPVGSGSAEEIILEFQKESPNGTKKQCKEKTGLSYSTIRKWWKEQESSIVSAEQMIVEFQKEFPKGTKKQCKEKTGLSYPTIRKWWKKDQ